MTQLYAQPYNTEAKGFLFHSVDEHDSNVDRLRDEEGVPVDEYEIQFIDGKDIDHALAKAWDLNQCNFAAFLEKVEDWKDWKKLTYIIAVGECDCDHDEIADDPCSADVTLHEVETMRELAEQFVDEGLFGDIPKPLENYIDYDAIARDLENDYSQVTIAGMKFIFHCA